MTLFLGVLASCGSSDDSSRVVIELSSDVTPLDRATVSVFGSRGAIVLDQELSDAGQLELPRRIRIDGARREELVRIMIWGEQHATRVAFGHAVGQLTPGVEDTVNIKLGAPAADCDDDGVPDELDGCVAIPDPAQDDPDADGTTSACTPGASCPANEVGNSDFEIGLMGWQASAASPATLTRITGGHSSGFAAELCKQPSGTTREYAMDDRPGWVTMPASGARYRADAWLRTGSATPAQQLDMRIGELSVPGGNPLPGTRVASTSANVEWQVVSTTYTIAAAQGASSLDMRFRVASAPDGTCFQIDDVCLQRLAPSCP